MITATKYHDFSMGHRVVGHEGKCRFLHGHNYRVHFTVGAPALDQVGRVLDFSVIGSRLCSWLEENWDHRFVAWENDPVIRTMFPSCDPNSLPEEVEIWNDSIVFVPFNPTAENMAQYLVEVIGPEQLVDTGCELVKCVIEETRKCSCTYEKE